MEQKKLIQYGVFWIPPHEICEQVEELKREMLLSDKNVSYANHPVHATIFLLNSSAETAQIVQKIDEAVSAIPNFSISFNGWLPFLNDAITGKHTLTVGISPNSKLHQFQKIIAKELFEYISGPISYAISWEGLFQQSYSQWGFPFVGPHWRPHLTIASTAQLALVNEMQEKYSLRDFSSVQFQNVSLFLIRGDNHTLLKTFYLPNR